MARQDKTELRQTLAKNIRSHMGRMQITAADLSKLSGVTQGMLSTILSCKSTTRLDTLQRLAEGLGVAASDLLLEDSKSAAAGKDEEFFRLFARWRLVTKLDRDIIRRILSRE
jgi:transcriptional regulator with XRE-family HTH domain